MDKQVKFKRGTQAKYDLLLANHTDINPTLSEDTWYYCYDTKCLYIGTELVNLPDYTDLEKSVLFAAGGNLEWESIDDVETLGAQFDVIAMTNLHIFDYPINDLEQEYPHWEDNDILLCINKPVPWIQKNKDNIYISLRRKKKHKGKTKMRVLDDSVRGHDNPDSYNGNTPIDVVCLGDMDILNDEWDWSNNNETPHFKYPYSIHYILSRIIRMPHYQNKDICSILKYGSDKGVNTPEGVRSSQPDGLCANLYGQSGNFILTRGYEYYDASVVGHFNYDVELVMTFGAPNLANTEVVLYKHPIRLVMGVQKRDVSDLGKLLIPQFGLRRINKR